MRRGGSKHFTEDDCYDDDDYYEEDDEYYEEAPVAKPKAVPAAAPSVAPGKNTGGKGGNTQPLSKTHMTPVETAKQIAKSKDNAATWGAYTSPATAKSSLVQDYVADDAERQVLQAVMPRVKDVIGSMVSDANIAAALRRVNYDADAAVDMLLNELSSGGGGNAAPTNNSTPPPQQPTPPAATQTSPPPAVAMPPRKGGARLVLGGSSSPGGVASPEPQPSAEQSPSRGPSTNTAAGAAAAPSLTTSTAASPTTSAAQHTFFPTSVDKVATDVRDEDGKQAISLVMAGHVDTGKSTILGHLLVKLGHFSEREVSKLEQQAKREGKASFHFAWILDQSEEERRRGVTIDAGIHSFETPDRRVSVLDAPGHKDYVAAMITSAAQADVALFTVSASKGEFESGLNHMTREHLSVLRTLGIPQVVVLVNKMDTVDFSKERFDEVVAKVEELAKSMNFREGVIVGYCPVSGYHAINLLPNTAAQLTAWYSGKSLVEYVNECQAAKRMLNYPVRMFVSDVTRQVITGKIETGVLKVGDQCVVVPSGNKVTIKGIERHLMGQVKSAPAGCSVDVTVSGDLQGVCVGDVLCPVKQRCPFSTTFEAHVQLFPNLKKALIPGSRLLLQMQALNTPVTVKRLLKRVDPATGTWSAAKMIKCLGADSQGLVEFELPQAAPLELAEDNRAFGRFVLRQEDETVGGGLIRGLPGIAPAQAAA